MNSPATGLMVVGALGLSFQMLGLVANLLAWARGHGGFHQMEEMLGIGIVLGSSIVTLGISLLILWGGSKMKKLESYSWGMSAAVLAVIPCFSPCCILGLPFGIWAITVLSDPRVKASFRS